MIGPSTGPLLQPRVSPAVTAGKSSCSPRVKRVSASMPLCITLGPPRLQVNTPSLQDHGQKGLDQDSRSRHARIHLAGLLDIDLRVLRPLRGGADEGEGHGSSRWPYERVYGDVWASGAWPASATCRRRVMKRQTVRAEWA